MVDIPEKRGQKLKIFLWPTYQKREDNSRYLCGRHTRKEGILSSRGVEMRGSIRSMIVRYSTCLTIPFCNVLTITKKRNPIKFNYTLHEHSLEHVTSAKYLGCTITSDLKWGPHICNKANSTYRQLLQEKSEYCQQISQRKGLSVTSETILRIV